MPATSRAGAGVVAVPLGGGFMLYSIYDVLRVLAAGGFFVRSVGLHGSSVVLYQFVDGHTYPHTDLSPRSFSRLLDTGIIFCAGAG